MKIEMNIPIEEMVFHKEVIITITIVAWYFVAGVIVNSMFKSGKYFLDFGSPDRFIAFLWWIFSPLILPFALLTAILWILSAGVVQPLWRW